jgi:hypothetical protein
MSEFSIVLTVVDQERNGFVSLAKSTGVTEKDARKFIFCVDCLVVPESEPDNDASFAFIIDLVSNNGDLVDTGHRLLPLQLAMSLAPDAVGDWLEERPDPNAVMHRQPILIDIDDLQRRVSGGLDGRSPLL